MDLAIDDAVVFGVRNGVRLELLVYTFFMQVCQIFDSLSMAVRIVSLGKFECTAMERMCEPCDAQILERKWKKSKY